MPKDATRNIDSNQLRSSQLNTYEFQHNQGEFTEQHKEHDNWMGAPENDTNLPPDKAKAERIRHLLEAHGESVPQTEENQSGDYEMKEPRKASQTLALSKSSASKNSNQRNEVEAGGDDFAPTHGRSPQVIKEMMQSRRATDKVPDPEDIASGRAAKSKEKKEHGETGQRNGTRQANKQSASAKSKPAQSPKGKEAALDKSKAGVSKGTSEKKTGQQSDTGKKSQPTTTAKSAKQSAAATGTKRAAASSNLKQAAPNKNAKQTASSKVEKQTAGRNGASPTFTNRGNGAKAALSQPKANGKSAKPTAKPAKATTSTRSKSPTGRSR